MDFQQIKDLAFIAAAVIGMGVFISGQFLKSKKENEQDANEVEEKLIDRLKSSVLILEKENEYLKRENTSLQTRLVALEQQVAQLKDLATNTTAINEVKSILQEFKFIIPMMEQFARADAQTLQGLSEIRDMIREDRKTIQRVERRMLEKNPSQTVTEEA